MVVPIMMAAVLATSAPQASPSPAPPAEGLEDVVVTARKGAPPPKLDAVGYFARLCHEPQRVAGEPAPPWADPDWQPLDNVARTRFGITDADTPAFGLGDAARGSSLLVKMEHFARAGGLVEHRCTLVVVGGTGQAQLPQRLSILFGGSGTQRHVGADAGLPAITGWTQWLWTAMPLRGSPVWRETNANSRTADRARWLVVVHPRFYDDHAYVTGELKTRTGAATALSVMTLSYTARPSKRPLGRGGAKR